MAPVLVHPLNIPSLPLTPTHDSNDIRTRRRSSTFSAITNWALAVQPGTPAPLSPLSPAKRRRPSLHRRVASNNSPSYPLTPTSAKSPTGDVDLTAWGYTSVFLRLPVTPHTPAAFRPREPVITEESQKGLKKIKSMGILRRNRAKSIIGDAPGSVAATSSSATSTSPTRARARSRSRSGSISHVKPSLKRPNHVKSKSVSATVPNKAKSKKAHPPLPPALQNELMLMQFAGGGSLEKNAQRFMEERSKTEGTSNAVNAVYRDENGVMWLDEDERAEYQSLIRDYAPSSPPASPWVQFTPSDAIPPASPTMGAITSDEDQTRRPSVVSLSPTERELEGAAAAIIRPASPSAYVAGYVTGLAPSTSSSSASSERTERRRRRRPAPLKLHFSSSVPTASHLEFEDSFEPTSAEAAALAAGMHSHTTRRGVASRRNSVVPRVLGGEVGSAPADVVVFDTTTMRGKGKKMNLAKRAKALFGIE